MRKSKRRAKEGRNRRPKEKRVLQSAMENRKHEGWQRGGTERDMKERGQEE